MPYADDPNLDEENNSSQSQSQNGGQTQSNTQLAGGGTVTGGASQTAGSSSGSAGNAPSAAPAPTHPSNYQNLNAYLDANSGSGFGQKFVGDVNNDVNAAQSAQSQGAQLFQGAADAGTVQQNQSAVNAAISDPYSVSQDPSQTAAFQQQLNAKYNGPQSYSDDQAAYQTAYGATQKAEDTAQAAQTEGGRFALLNNYFGTPSYNQGQQSLDNLLVQADPTTAQGIQQARQNADQSLVSFQNQSAPLQQYAAQDNATTQATAAAAALAGNNAITGMSNDYATDLTNAQSGFTSAMSNAQAALSGPQSQWYQTMAQYGTPGQAFASPADPYHAATTAPAPTPPAGTVHIGGTGPDPRSLLSPAPQSYWGVNPNSFLAQSGTAPDASNVLSLPQQQKLDALQGLMGQAQTPLNAAEAGGYNPQTNGIAFNTQGFNQAMQTAENSYNQTQQGILSNIQSIANQPIRGDLSGNNAAGMIPSAWNQVQAQYNQLNTIRANYGLPPVSNPYVEQGSQPNTGGTIRGNP